MSTPVALSLPCGVERGARRHSFGFWAAALAFLFNMGLSAVPTPLYPLYERRDHFSTVMVTVVFAVYAVGVVVSLFLGGHLSDRVGRKTVFVPTLLVNVISAAVFIVVPGLAGLLVARVLSGISVGLTTATATAYLAELHAGTDSRSLRRAEVVATAANLGGIGFGPLASGLLAQFAPAPLRVPYLVFGVLLLVLAGMVALSPETASPPHPRQPYRPQRIAVPAQARAVFFAATAAGFGSFAVLGVLTSLAPSFLAGTLHSHSAALAGAVAFAAFAAAAAAQIATSRTSVRGCLYAGVAITVPALSALIAGMWLPSLWLFVAGAGATGVGAGLVFKGAIVSAGAGAPPGARAEVLAGFFLGAYVGLSVPVVGLGIATRYAPAHDVMLVFALLMVTVMASAVRLLDSASQRG